MVFLKSREFCSVVSSCGSCLGSFLLLASLEKQGGRWQSPGHGHPSDTIEGKAEPLPQSLTRTWVPVLIGFTEPLMDVWTDERFTGLKTVSVSVLLSRGPFELESDAGGVSLDVGEGRRPCVRYAFKVIRISVFEKERSVFTKESASVQPEGKPLKPFNHESLPWKLVIKGLTGGQTSGRGQPRSPQAPHGFQRVSYRKGARGARGAGWLLANGPRHRSLEPAFEEVGSSVTRQGALLSHPTPGPLGVSGRRAGRNRGL